MGNMANYSPRAAFAARYRKTTAGPRMLARAERRARRDMARRDGVLTRPDRTPFGRKLATLGPEQSWPEEWRYMRRMALADALGRGDAEGYMSLWHELVEDTYRAKYRSQHKRS